MTCTTLMRLVLTLFGHRHALRGSVAWLLYADSTVFDASTPLSSQPVRLE